MVAAVEAMAVHLRLATAGPPPVAAVPDPVNGRPDRLGGSHRHPIELAEAHDQSRKS